MENSPDLWLARFPFPGRTGSKYDRGHAIIVGGPVCSTGAGRMAARACLRIGAGLVSVACDRESLAVYAFALEAVMTKVIADEAAFAELISDPRVAAILIGPAAGINGRTKANALAALKTSRPCVLDADALTVFKDQPSALFGAISGPTILTPHEGEFVRLFGSVSKRQSDALRAAKASGAIVVLKGEETVIAAPDGQFAINRGAPPWLATAGTGDVLAGMCCGLMSQGMAAFDAACAAVWIHAEAARRFGAGLIAEDLPGLLPSVLRDLHQRQSDEHNAKRNPAKGYA